MPPIIVSLRPSRQLALLLAVVLGSALLAILTLQLGWVTKTALIAVLVISGWRAWRAVTLLPIVALRLGRQGQCEVELSDTLAYPASVEHYSIFLEHVVALVLRTDGARHVLVLMPDSAPSQALRRLRVWLTTSV